MLAKDHDSVLLQYSVSAQSSPTLGSAGGRRGLPCFGAHLLFTNPASGDILYRMRFYLFRSGDGGSVKAVSFGSGGEWLPYATAPWARYQAGDELMEYVHAVSDEIQAGLDARGYYLLVSQLPTDLSAPAA